MLRTEGGRRKGEGVWGGLDGMIRYNDGSNIIFDSRFFGGDIFIPKSDWLDEL